MIAFFLTPPSAVQSIPDIIKQASASPLGIFAFMILGVGILAFYFFRAAPVNIRALMFLCMFLGVVCYGVAITRAATPQPAPIDPASLDGVVVDSMTNSPISNAQITVTGASAPGISDGNGEFHIRLMPRTPGTSLNMRVTKQGYDTVDWSVKPPFGTGLRVPLSKFDPKTDLDQLAGELRAFISHGEPNYPSDVAVLRDYATRYIDYIGTHPSADENGTVMEILQNAADAVTNRHDFTTESEQDRTWHQIAARDDFKDFLSKFHRDAKAQDKEYMDCYRSQISFWYTSLSTGAPGVPDNCAKLGINPYTK